MLFYFEFDIQIALDYCFCIVAKQLDLINMKLKRDVNIISRGFFSIAWKYTKMKTTVYTP